MRGRVYKVKNFRTTHLFFHNQYAIRSKIKKCFLFKESAQLTKRSVKKFVCLHVLLVGIVVSLEELQEITE